VDLSKLEAMSINEALGRVIVRLRKARNQSQEDFAWSIGSGNKYMSDVELGKRNVSLLFANKVAEGFGLTIYQLFVEIEKEMSCSHTE
jgi:transcriptional regulator with XRE-family HTH domain